MEELGDIATPLTATLSSLHFSPKLVLGTEAVIPERQVVRYLANDVLISYLAHYGRVIPPRWQSTREGWMT